MLEHVGEWQGDGLWTPEAYLQWRTGIAPATASKIVDVARRSAEFPACVEALGRGELSLDQLAPITRHAPGWCDAQMAGLAPRCTVAQISKIARDYPWDLTVDDSTAEPDDTAEHGSEATDERSSDDGSADASLQPDLAPADEAWFGWDDHGRFRLGLNVGADTGAIIEHALTEARDTLFQTGDTPVDTIDTVDAVLAIAERSLDAVEADTRRNRYRVNIHIDRHGHVTDQRSRTLPDAAVARITCDALLAPIWCDNGLPVSVGRSQHIVPDRTRRIV